MLSADGLLTTAELTLMRPARPVNLRAVLGVSGRCRVALPSVNNASCGMPPASDVLVIVLEAALTVAEPDPQRDAQRGAGIGEAQAARRRAPC